MYRKKYLKYKQKYMDLKQLGGADADEDEEGEKELVFNIHKSETIYNQMPIPGNEDDHEKVSSSDKISLNSSQCMDLATKLGNEPWKKLHLLLLEWGKTKDTTNPRHPLYYIPSDQHKWITDNKNNDLSVNKEDEDEDEEDNSGKLKYKEPTYWLIRRAKSQSSDEEEEE